MLGNGGFLARHQRVGAMQRSLHGSFSSSGCTQIHSASCIFKERSLLICGDTLGSCQLVPIHATTLLPRHGSFGRVKGSFQAACFPSPVRGITC